MKRSKFLYLNLFINAFALIVLAACSIQFKSAPMDANSVKITGNIYKPAGAGPFPAVIIMHGCNGMLPHHTDWARQVMSWGYVAFPINSFGGRGVTDVCKKPWKASPNDRALDAMGAALYLKQLPYVDGDNIGILGFSHGGSSVLAATKTNLLHYIAKMETFPFKAAVAFYPYCTPSLDNNLAVPTLILIGEKDDWTPAGHCMSLPKLAETQGMIDVIVYEDAYHSFDVYGEPRHYLGHFLEYNPTADRKARKATRYFFDKHLKR